MADKKAKPGADESSRFLVGGFLVVGGLAGLDVAAAEADEAEHAGSQEG
jgi:hypothetical protein